jgi:creatinine amidohydrolase
MQWENLTSPDFAAAVKHAGVCIVAFGVVERHSDHLPLGTDFLNSHLLASLAAEKEPAVVFPSFYFGQINEARCFPGTLTLRPALLLEVIQSVFDEIGRNGFEKIILLNGHGGNGHLLPFLAQSALYQEKPYRLYMFNGELNDTRRKVWEQTVETPFHGHACECETSISLANHPELVHMERVPQQGGESQGHLNLEGNYSGIEWYADHPEHYAGDARPASAQKGMLLRGLLVDEFAEYIARVKADRAVAALEGEFFRREGELREQVAG